MSETEHKPLFSPLKTKQLGELTPRIQRFRMRLIRFSYEITHTAGKNLMTANSLSRVPGSRPKTEAILVCKTKSYSIPRALVVPE